MGMIAPTRHTRNCLPGTLFAISLCWLACPPVTSAQSGETVGPPKGEAAAGELPGSAADILQAGARVPGKAPRSEPQSKDAQEAEPKGTSSLAAKKAALAAIPLDQLSPERRQSASALLKAASFYRRLPKVTFSIEPEVYSYFVAHPDVAVSIWRAMKISKLQLWQTGRFDYEADAGDGSTGKLEVLHSGPEKCLVSCNGLYKSPLFSKSIEVRSLMLLQTSFFREVDGTIYVTHRADLFVEFPSQTIDVVARIFSPLTVAMTDRTFSEISLFLKMMSLAMARRPDWVEQIAGKMDGVADLRKTQILELTSQVYAAAQKRAVERANERDDATSSIRSPGQPPSAVQPAGGSAAESPAGPAPTTPTGPAGSKPSKDEP